MGQVYIDDLNRNSARLGGHGKVVEIDEARFWKRKYNRGRIIEGQWVLGCSWERVQQNLPASSQGM